MPVGIFPVFIIFPSKQALAVCMKCQSLFSGKNKKSAASLLSAELAQGVVMVQSKHLC